ncbi:MAG: WecB/TagA/CpsF family glycosyltransferase [Selenomonadaceae bacterium]|nr:WecB/TagA/CpsF family glycosyltransferase [Selenomonadaceae bacterium]MBR4382583.1 WecB/TagA/CpsF family glycosyltransferase [Selenomonadaceae bacterium]
MNERVEILGVKVDAVTMAQAVERVANLIDAGKPSIVATANAEMLLRATHDDELKNILNAASLVVPDGAGTVWAARHLGKEMPERVAGFDLVQELMKLAPVKGRKFFLFGSAPGIADKAKAKAEELYPGIKIVGTRNGYFTANDEPEIVSQIKSSRADILLAALGVPKQEKWLAKFREELQIPVSIGVGGTFDVMAGVVKRAPLWMQRARLEWLFRAMLQPSRAGRLIALPKFVLKVHQQKVSG